MIVLDTMVPVLQNNENSNVTNVVECYFYEERDNENHGVTA